MVMAHQKSAGYLYGPKTRTGRKNLSMYLFGARSRRFDDYSVVFEDRYYMTALDLPYIGSGIDSSDIGEAGSMYLFGARSLMILFIIDPCRFDGQVLLAS